MPKWRASGAAPRRTNPRTDDADTPPTKPPRNSCSPRAGTARPDRASPPRRPADVADALAIQRRVAELVGQPVGGWKCSVPTDAASGPRRADLRADDRPRVAVTRSSAPATTAKIEPEIAFVLAHDLPRARRPTARRRCAPRCAKRASCSSSIGARYADPSVVTFRNCSPTASPTRGSSSAPSWPTPGTQPLETFPITSAPRHGDRDARRQAPGRPSAAPAVLARQLPRQRRHAAARRPDRDDRLVLRRRRGRRSACRCRSRTATWARSR